MQKTIFNYGIRSMIIGLLLFGLSLLLSQYMELGNGELFGYAGIILALTMVYFGIKAYRDKVNNGQVSFSKALLIGLGISAFGALGIALMDMLYTGVIDPDWAVKYQEEMAAQGYEDTPMYSTPVLGVMMFGIVMTVGAIISLLSALILKRQD